MILYRVFPWDPRAVAAEPGGALFWPRSAQGSGRHDNPDRYGAMYGSESETAVLAEALAPFRGSGGLIPAMLERSGRRLALASIELDERAELIDLDDPAVLDGEGLRPSRVATRTREVTQAYAAELFDRHPSAAGLWWWSTLESLWINVTLFDRARGQVRLGAVGVLSIDDEPVREAAVVLGLT